MKWSSIGEEEPGAYVGLATERGESFLIGKFVETTSLAVNPFLLPSALYQLQRRKKETKIYVVVFFLNEKPFRKPVCRLIPAKHRINHSPPYLLGVTHLGSNKHNYTESRYVD
jgi:hypothetical protein